MNWGEYVHFMSGAAGRDLKPLATKAFGWPGEWEEKQHQKARTEFLSCAILPPLDRKLFSSRRGARP